MEFELFEVNSGKIELSAVIPYKSLVFEMKYRESGSLQVVFPRSKDSLAAVKVGRFATAFAVPANVLMYIHTVKVTDTEVWAYGYEAKELLNKCAMFGTGEEPFPGEAAAATLIANAINALYKFSWATTPAEISGISGNIDPAGIEYLSLLEFVDSICELNDAGIMLYRTNAGKGAIKIYAGTDRSNSIVFSDVFGSLDGSETTDSDRDYINKVVAVGSDNIFVRLTDPQATGEIYSLSIDYRSSFPRDSETTVGDYLQAVIERARMQMTAQKQDHRIDIGAVDTSDYGKEYILGDIVGIYDNAVKATLKYRVAAVRYTAENNKTSVTLGLEAI